MGNSLGEGIGYPLQCSWVSLVDQMVKNLPAMWETWVQRSPGAGHGNPLQYSCLENPHGQRSLVGYSPWGHKELDMTEKLSTTHILSKIFSVIFGRHDFKIYTAGLSKITVNNDCSHEIKRHLLLGRKAMTNLDSIDIFT